MGDHALYYWPIPFRGHFIRYVLAVGGAEWEEFGFDEVRALKDAPVAEQPYPAMAPPILHDRAADRWLSQMPAIQMYLGRKFGLIGDLDLDLRLIADASDILFEITRTHGAQMWDRQSWHAFTTHRLPRWLEIHERLVTDHAGNGCFGGDTPVLSDLTMAALWHTMAERLPGMRAYLEGHAPALMRLVGRVADLPPITALRAEWRGRTPVYCGGQIEASLLEMLKEG